MRIFFTSLLVFMVAMWGCNSFADPSIKQSSQNSQASSSIAPIDMEKMYKEAERYFQLAQAWKKLRCDPKSGFICDKHECKNRDTKIYLLLDKKAGKIMRCESEELCDSFEAEFAQSGAFTNVQTKGPIGSVIRVLGDSRYKEVTTVALDAYIANGECKVVE